MCILHMKNADMDILDFVVIDEQTIIKVHLEILWRQHGLETTLPQFTYLGIFKVNNNQPVDLFQNQIMRCIICMVIQLHLKYWPCTFDSKRVSLHIINLRHNNHGKTCWIWPLYLTQMFFRKCSNHIVPRSPLYHESSKKRTHVYPTTIYITNKFKRDDVTQMGFMQYLMLFVVKGLLFVRTIESIWL